VKRRQKYKNKNKRIEERKESEARESKGNWYLDHVEERHR
jgi:hypothetical protein